MLEVAIASVEAVFDWKAYQSGDIRMNPNTLVEEEDNEMPEEGAQTSPFEELPFVEEEEDDEILKALDRFFVMDDEDGEKRNDEGK